MTRARLVLTIVPPDPASEIAMIARIWRGATRSADAARYAAYMRETGVDELSAAPGNRGVLLLHRVEADRAHFTVISLWESLDAVRGFAGPRPERAVFYPQDEAFLIERGPLVEHWTVDDAVGLPD